MAQHQVYTPVDFNDKTVFNNEAEHNAKTTFNDEVEFNTQNITLDKDVIITSKDGNTTKNTYQIAQDGGYFTTRPIQVIVNESTPINFNNIFIRSEYFIPNETVAKLCTGLPTYGGRTQYGLLEICSIDGYQFSHEYHDRDGRAFQRLTTPSGEMFFRKQSYTNSWESTWDMYLKSNCSSYYGYTLSGDGSYLIRSMEDWAKNGIKSGEHYIGLNGNYADGTYSAGLSGLYDNAQRDQNWCYLYLTKIRLEGYFSTGGSNQYWYQQMLAPHDLLIPIAQGETSYKFRYPHTTTWTNGLNVITENNIDSYKDLILKLSVTYKRTDSLSKFQYWLNASTSKLTISDLTSYDPGSSYTHIIRLIFDAYLVK